MTSLYVSSLVMTMMVAGGQATSPNAPTEPNGKMSAAVRLIDPDKRIMIVTVPVPDGQRIYQYGIPAGTKFLDQDGNPIKKGVAADVFKSDIQRPDVPVTIKFDSSGKITSIKLR
jgi:hypothetical protein